MSTRSLPNSGEYSDDNVIVSLQFANGSLGTIDYLANGDRAYSKERVEVFGGKSTAVLEDFRFLELVQHGKKEVMRSRFRQDKGHLGGWRAFVNAIRSGGTRQSHSRKSLRRPLRLLQPFRRDQSVRPFPLTPTHLWRLRLVHTALNHDVIMNSGRFPLIPGSI